MAYELYTILWVDRSASQEDIKRAYRKKAMELHPDRHRWDKDKEAEFKKVNEAYSVLSDEQKRAQYDRFGTSDSGQWFSGFWGGFQGDFNMGDIFETFFSWASGFGSSGGRRRDVGDDLEIEVRLTFEEAYRGLKKEVSFSKRTICGDCGGTGAKSKDSLTTCPDCSGTGKVRRRVQTLFGVMEQASVCERCSGTGKVIKEACSTCKGRKYVDQNRTRTVEVPAGIDNDMTIKLRDEGHEGVDGAGDLFIHFSVPEEYDGLVRDGNDIIYGVRLDPVEFILGTKRSLNIPILWAHEVDVKPGTDPESELVFRNEWFPNVTSKSQTRGNLIIRLHLEIPKKLSKKERELYEAIAKEKRLDTYDSKGFFEKLFD